MCFNWYGGRIVHQDEEMVILIFIFIGVKDGIKQISNIVMSFVFNLVVG